MNNRLAFSVIAMAAVLSASPARALTCEEAMDVVGAYARGGSSCSANLGYMTWYGGSADAYTCGKVKFTLRYFRSPRDGQYKCMFVTGSQALPPYCQSLIENRIQVRNGGPGGPLVPLPQECVRTETLDERPVDILNPRDEIVVEQEEIIDAPPHLLRRGPLTPESVRPLR